MAALYEYQGKYYFGQTEITYCEYLQYLQMVK